MNKNSTSTNHEISSEIFQMTVVSTSTRLCCSLRSMFKFVGVQNCMAVKNSTKEFSVICESRRSHEDEY
jgi:hypothetical protein